MDQLDAGTFMETLLYIIPLLPLGAFLLNGLFGSRLKAFGAWLAFFAMAGSAAISIFLLLNAAHVLHGGPALPMRAVLWEWIAADTLSIDIAFHYDQLTAIMCSVITGIGSLVFLYAIGYMKGDPGINRFFAYLSLFAFSMLILVLGSSLPLLFVGWEGVGLCSYLLIGYYMDMPGAADAGKKAFVVNRIGDAGFLLAMFMIFHACGTLDIQGIIHAAEHGTWAYGGGAITLITLLLFLGCTGKSAQIPLFVWLPDAMAGPTPVSALIHAATMVTAGIYLLVRAGILFTLAPATMLTIAIVGCLTAFVAGTIALTQKDIKKIWAYSTVSQLGYMFLACGVGAFAGGMFHVVTHAFFKACLFLGSGAVIHAIGGVQDVTRMGGLRKHLPVVWITFFAACLAIAGFPLTAGFFSKDEILWKTFASGHGVLYVVGLITALMTAVYSFRALLLTFHGETRMSLDMQSHIHHPDWTMKLPLIILAAGALLVGFLNVPPAMAQFVPGGVKSAFLFEHFLHPVLHPAEHVMRTHSDDYFTLHNELVELMLACVSVVIVFIGLFLAKNYIAKDWPNHAETLSSRYNALYQLSSKRWWWDDLYNFVFVGGAMQLARFSVWIDRKVIDGFLLLLGRATQELGKGAREFQSSGQVQLYGLVVLIGVNALVGMILFWVMVVLN